MQRLLVISSYPPVGSTHHQFIVGVASYTKNTIRALLQTHSNLSITVLAEELPHQTRLSHEGKCHIKRIWRRNSLSAFKNLLTEISTNHKNDTHILLEFELAMFGRGISLLVLPFFLLALRLMGKRVTIIFHQVIRDINTIAGHINIQKHSLFSILYNLALSYFYTATSMVVSHIIVFEEVLKTSLPSYALQKTTVIPHGVEEFSSTVKPTFARRKLSISPNTFVVLLFGFIAWYKGTDRIAAAFKKRGKHASNELLLIAGGPNPNHFEKPFYIKYVKGVTTYHDATTIRVTGFVDEDDIPLYYQSADVVIFPYRTLMSSSGPLSIALSFNKPILLSRVLENILRTSDAASLLSHHGLSASDITFESDQELNQKLDRIKEDQVFKEKITSFSSDLAKMRSWKKIAILYYEVLSAQS